MLIHGAGGVRAGIWTRSVLISDGLQLASVFPFVEAAEAEGYSVIVANPNQNTDETTGDAVPRNEG